MGWLMQFPTFRLLEFEASSGEQRTKMAQELDTICRDTGFCYWTTMGSLSMSSRRSGRWSQDFSRAPSLKNKRLPHLCWLSLWLAWAQSRGVGRVKGEKTPPDLKESFNGGPLSIPENIADTRAYEFCYQPTLWPDIEGFKELGVDITKRWKI